MKEIELKNLYRISTYAKLKNVTTTCVWQWIRSNKVAIITIDGTIFVKEDEVCG